MIRRSALGRFALASLSTLLLALPGHSAFLSDFPNWTVVHVSENEGSFGWCVSSAGDVNDDGFDDVIVTALTYQSHEDDSQEGAAWVFAGTAAGSSVDAVWMYESDRSSAQFGASADAAGDVNGDGYDDIVVGAPRYKAPEWSASRGAVYVFHGSPNGLSPAPDSFFTPIARPGAQRFGESVAGVGDINGDGYDDVAVGVGIYEPGDGVERWALFVYYGSAEGLEDDPDIVVPDENAKMGSIHVAAAGDVNGDGFDDVIAGDPYYFNTETQEGAAFVYAGSSDGIDPAPIWEVHCDQPHQASFAYRVAGAGDVNGDGFDDVLVGAMGYARPELPEGAAFLYFGSSTGPSPEPDWAGYPNGYVPLDEHADANYGHTLNGAGDVDGDGYDDIVIEAGRYTASADAPLPGAVFVHRGSPTGPVETPDWIGYAPDEYWGYLNFPSTAVAGAGDVNGDGHADIIVGDADYRFDEEFGGGAAAYYGGPVDADDDDSDDDTQDDDDDDDTDDDNADDDGSGGVDDDDIPDTNGTRGDSLVQDDGGPCGC